MEGLVSFGNKRSYEDFKKQISPKIQSQFDSIRQFCFTLGENLIEDVRMHRVVMCKSMTFRWFLDLEPQNDSIILVIQKSRKDPKKTIVVKQNDSLDPIKEIILDAYNLIR